MNEHLSYEPMPVYGRLDKLRQRALREVNTVSLALRPLNGPDYELAGGWLCRPEIQKWLYFGNGRRTLTPVQLMAASRNAHNVVRLFCCGPTLRPVGIIGLSDLSPSCRTASIWIVRAVFSREDGPAVAERAGIALLDFSFRQLGLESVSGWAASCNRPSLSIAQAVGFKIFGRQRACHGIKDKVYDRIHFDITRDEFFTLHPSHDVIHFEE